MEDGDLRGERIHEQKRVEDWWKEEMTGREGKGGRGDNHEMRLIEMNCLQQTKFNGWKRWRWGRNEAEEDERGTSVVGIIKNLGACLSLGSFIREKREAKVDGNRSMQREENRRVINIPLCTLPSLMLYLFLSVVFYQLLHYVSCCIMWAVELYELCIPSLIVYLCCCSWYNTFKTWIFQHFGFFHVNEVSGIQIFRVSHNIYYGILLHLFLLLFLIVSFSSHSSLCCV